jgi:energy-coupling factor transporter ATP-binding protein EcfA2
MSEEITLEFETGQIVGILGANGAGKTTLLNCLGGVAVPTTGRLLYEDSGKVSPLHGVYPLRYGLASRVMAKVNLMRTLAWLPLVAVLAIVDAKIDNGLITEKLWLAAKGVPLWLAWMPIVIAGKFSKGTNDTLLVSARQIVLVPLVMLVVSGMVILWATILIVDRPEVLVGAMAAIAASVGVWAAYGWWYNAKWTCYETGSREWKS